MLAGAVTPNELKEKQSLKVYHTISKTIPNLYQGGVLMVKQMLVKCICGQALDFPEGQIKTKCNCGAAWECGDEGYWYCVKSVVPVVRPRNKRKRRAGIK